MRPVTVSQTGVGNSPWIPLDIHQNPFNVTLAVEVTGTVTYSVVWTTDDIWNVTNPTATAGPNNLQAATTNQVGDVVYPVTAVQLQVTAGTGTAQLRVIQSGTMSG
jgi:hypothetical protein